MKKYELVETDTDLYRVRALRDFGNIKKGELGGFVQSEYNLSHEGDCWIYDDAKAYEDSKVLDDAKLFDSAMVYGHATIHNNAMVYDKARAYGNASVLGSTRIHKCMVCKGKRVYDGS